MAFAVLSLWSISGCGGGTKAGPPIFPGRIILSPGGSSSLVLGGTLSFTASASTTSGTNIATTITYSSSDTSILTLAPNGVACAGQWDIAFTTCTPGATGPVQVTASALGAHSIPTWVFVHPPIDSITVTGVLLDGVPVQEPCLSQSQSMSVEAHAYSQGVDITAAVGPFTFSANNATVVNLIPLVNTFYNFPTNQATAAALFPGITQIYASASGVSSSTFAQPQFQNPTGGTSPALDFFATCPIQNIALELNATGSQQNGQTSFVTAKGTTQTATAVLTDVMGNSSLANKNGGIVLSKIPLTWTASQPAVLSASSGCTETCALATPSVGAGTVTASCSPPTCNIGFPTVPASLSTPAQLTSCTQFFNALYPKFIDCQLVIPAPVYSNVAISGSITGSTSPVSVLATSTGCANDPPNACSTGVYSFTASKGASGSAVPLPTAANSLLFDLAGDKAYEGSAYGAQLINPANFGSSTSPFTALGTVTGQVLATSNNGNMAVFSDTIHSPNQVYIVNATNTTNLTATPLSITGAVAAGFSPDGLKTFIIGGSNANSLYVYSPLQALQGPIALAGPANAVAFSPNSAFAYIAESSTGTSSANITAFANCITPSNPASQAPVSVPLPANPILMKVLPGVHIDGTDSSGNPIKDGVHVFVLDATGFDIVTSVISPPPPPAHILCPQSLAFDTVQRVELNQGTLQPINFFASADGSLLYIASANNASILVYNFGSGAVTGIELQGGAVPLSADMSVDAGTILVAGSDGMLHQVSTALGGSDMVPISFPNLDNYLNPFCTFTPTQGPCTFNTILAKP
ncbi:MAG TPA: hypothetical protein VGM18_16000 [Candidatus Sulfotelmatobacter sp.]